jgi:energy-converting hydrogenase Eha subunit C
MLSVEGNVVFTGSVGVVLKRRHVNIGFIVSVVACCYVDICWKKCMFK